GTDAVRSRRAEELPTADHDDVLAGPGCRGTDAWAQRWIREARPPAGRALRIVAIAGDAGIHGRPLVSSTRQQDGDDTDEQAEGRGPDQDPAAPCASAGAGCEHVGVHEW